MKTLNSASDVNNHTCVCPSSDKFKVIVDLKVEGDFSAFHMDDAGLNRNIHADRRGGQVLNLHLHAD